METFTWNGVRAIDLGIYSTLKTKPVMPAPKTIIEELPCADGFFDFSAFNNDRRVHYSPRDWQFDCAIEKTPDEAVAALSALLSSYSGELEYTGCPGVRWRGVVTNRLDLTTIAYQYGRFSLLIRTQPWGEGLSPVEESFIETSDRIISVNNIGDVPTRPVVTVTGTVYDKMTFGGREVPVRGILTDKRIDAPELVKGINSIAVSGFDGRIRIVYTPLYIWQGVQSGVSI